MILKELRIKKAMTTVDLARAAGISQGSYSNIELGRRTATSVMAKKIADALGEDVPLVTSAINETPRRTFNLYSWISAIRINRLPLLKAFKYYVEAEKIPIDDISILKRELVDFVRANIALSLVEELSEREDILRRIQVAIGQGRMLNEHGRQNI